MKHLFTLIFLASTLCLQAQTVSIGGTSYNTIQEAIDAALDNDVIDVAGVHTESIDISKSITLRGTDPTTDIIQLADQPLNDGAGSSVVNIVRSNVNDDLTILVENLGIRHGNAPSSQNGGGLNIDKITGLLTLKNLIIENNFTAKNGGGLSIVGSNVNVVNCTIRNNSSTLDGGGIITTPNNAAGVNNTVNIEQSLLDSNTGRNGGGVFINGNKDFGDQYTIDFNVVNSTISNNTTTSGSSGAGGGAIWCKVAQLVGGTTGVGNINLKFVHTTMYNNLHASAVKNGISFSGPSGVTTNFSLYNSILVTADVVSQKAINFNNSNTTNVVNCILGGLEGASPFLDIIDNTTNNNLKGKTATFAGIATALSSEGGSTQVLALGSSANAVDHCTAATGITLPTVDQRGYNRDATPDAGAFEFGGTLGFFGFKDSLPFSVYPNPASQFIHIDADVEVRSVKIYSLLGALEKSIHGTNTVDISNLNKGVHLLVVESDGKQSAKQLIIE